MQRVKSADEYYQGLTQWREELLKLRVIVLKTGLEETVKWGGPSYTHDGKLVVGIAGFKNHFALWFHQGALLTDKAGKLVNAQEGTTKANRQWRFTSAKEINARLIASYIKESVALMKAGKSIKPDRAKPIDVPSELASALGKKKKLKAAFEALGKGKQREYAEHVSSAKREETRLARLEKILPMIEAGKGLNDKYR